MHAMFLHCDVIFALYTLFLGRQSLCLAHTWEEGVELSTITWRGSIYTYSLNPWSLKENYIWFHQFSWGYPHSPPSYFSWSHAHYFVWNRTLYNTHSVRNSHDQVGKRTISCCSNDYFPSAVDSGCWEVKGKKLGDSSLEGEHTFKRKCV